jgi:hypothetical protein
MPTSHGSGLRFAARLRSWPQQTKVPMVAYRPPLPVCQRYLSHSDAISLITRKHAHSLLLTLKPLPFAQRTPASSKMAPNSSSHTVTRAHSGHSHHHPDNTYLISKDKSDPGVRITRIGLVVNIAMAAGKGVGGVVFQSQGLTFRHCAGIQGN